MALDAEVAIYLFPFVTVMNSIPVYSIIVRYNLLESGYFNTLWAYLVSTVFPYASLPCPAL